MTRSSVTTCVAVLPAGTFTSKRYTSLAVSAGFVVSSVRWKSLRTGCSTSTSRSASLRLTMV